MIRNHLLTWMTFAPAVGMVVVALLPGGARGLIRWTAAAFTGATLALAVYLYQGFSTTLPGVTDYHSFQFVEHYQWIPGFAIDYFVGVDGLSVTMVLLTALLSFLGVFASWSIDKGVKGFFAMFLLLETGMIGTFVALDLILFYVFWEVMLLPMYFLIGVWGGPRRVYAAIKFFLYTLFGSLLLLLAILALYHHSEPHSFNMVALANSGGFVGHALKIGPWALDFSKVVFLALFVGFAIKIPAFPFHTWLPDAHVEAPTAVSVILAGVLLKMGTYGILRVCYPILPSATLWFSTALAVLAVVNIVYGALCAMAQQDFKALVAYSSISHMGFVMLGMAAFTPQAMAGAVLQMFNHGTITAMLFLLVGVLYDRAHHREIDGFGGLALSMPKYSTFTALAFFAAIGLPGLSGFVSEVLVLLGAWKTYPGYTALGASGIILGAGYMLWTLQRVFLGPVNEKYAGIAEINGREIFTLAPLALLVVGVGIYPRPVLELMTTSLGQLLRHITRDGALMAGL